MIDWFADLPKPLATFLIAALPVAELRASIPIAITVWKMNPLAALLWSVAGNLLPMLVILYYFEPLQRFLSARFPMARKFFEWLFARTRARFNQQYEKYGAIALCIFVAVPLPATGAWTGALAAWLFDIKKTHAIVAITLGTLIAGILVTLVTAGVGFGLQQLL